VIGSVKTSSKDRIDNIFLDKFLYCKLTETALPHIAIFLNDVQLDGVYYCDIRPNIQTDKLLKPHIRTIDHFFCSDIWTFIEGSGTPLAEVKVVEEDQP